ncbi:MAG: hemerythrin domain-containing protein [Rhodospirillales bacterium]|nr:hemerythrin domain-containing protein [Rhodospirillales bacterium]
MQKLFQWRPSFETGHSVIDEQHRSLVDFLQTITLCLGDKKGGEALAQCRKFREFLKQHFTNEEEILTQAGFPRLDSHLDAHREALDKYTTLFSECGESCTKSGNSQCMESLSYLLFDHFLRGDLDFKSFLQSKNLASETS